MIKLKKTRTVTYRQWGIPAVILEGKWLEKLYHWKIGDQIGIEFQPTEIRLKKITKGSQNKKMKVQKASKVDERCEHPFLSLRCAGCGWQGWCSECTHDTTGAALCPSCTSEELVELKVEKNQKLPEGSYGI